MKRRRTRDRCITLVVPPSAGLVFAETLLHIAARRDGATQDELSPSHRARTPRVVQVALPVLAVGLASLFTKDSLIRPEVGTRPRGSGHDAGAG